MNILYSFIKNNDPQGLRTTIENWSGKTPIEKVLNSATDIHSNYDPKILPVEPGFYSTAHLTLIEYAAAHNNVECLKVLTDFGVCEQPYGNVFPYHWAAKNNSVQAIEFLHACGWDIHKTNSFGNTALMDCSSGRTVEKFIQLGVDPKVTNKSNETALHVFTKNNLLDAAQKLCLNLNVRFDARDRWGNTPTDSAKGKNNQEFVELLCALEQKQRLLRELVNSTPKIPSNPLRDGSACKIHHEAPERSHRRM